MQRRRKAATLISEFDALVEKTSARRDKPYVFNRADAYEEMYGTVKAGRRRNNDV